VPAVSDAIEGGDSIGTARYGFAIENAGARAQTGQRLDNERKVPSQVIPWPAVEPHPCAFLAGDDPEAVVLDFMQPIRAGWRTRGACGEARCNEAGWQGTRSQQHARATGFAAVAGSRSWHEC
jgi:hypothetical protein